ncbi:MAG: DUF4173 domain-containing protein [Planctomycetaceae bacterium]|nr:DUF4173 domain-containing protein [Planctomycetaceae bacterium]
MTTQFPKSKTQDVYHPFLWIVVAGVTALADVLLYRSHGFAGPATFFPIATIALLLAHKSSRDKPLQVSAALCLILVMLLALCLSMLWSGGPVQLLIAFWLMNAALMLAQGSIPFLLESFVFIAGVIPAGYDMLNGIEQTWREKVLAPVDRRQPGQSLTVALPVISAFIFGIVFLLANPDLIGNVSRHLADFLEAAGRFLWKFSFAEILFWGLVIWLTAGLLRPLVGSATEEQPSTGDDVDQPSPHPLFSAFRNTLITLIVMFAGYLSFEFRTLWFRVFPEGFHYSGYAHEGAAWLTVALALATVMLSLIFRGAMLSDTRIGQLRRLAWIWSALNLLLAASVYNRLWIYVGFNGMTRMRVVGLLGISAVVVGFVLVLIKIRRQKNFAWLIRRQLWVPGFAVYLMALMPVDLLAHRYNVTRIMNGSLAPSVQISEHPMSVDALPQLLPLLECEDTLIREGVQSLLAERLNRLIAEEPNDRHWTSTQLGRERAIQALKSAVPDLLELGNSPSELALKRQRFREYAMQWW